MIRFLKSLQDYHNNKNSSIDYNIINLLQLDLDIKDYKIKQLNKEIEDLKAQIEYFQSNITLFMENEKFLKIYSNEDFILL